MHAMRAFDNITLGPQLAAWTLKSASQGKLTICRQNRHIGSISRTMSKDANAKWMAVTNNGEFAEQLSRRAAIRWLEDKNMLDQQTRPRPLKSKSLLPI